MTSTPVHLERKVIVGSVLTLLASGGIAVLNGLNGSQLLHGMPAWAQSVVVTFGPPVLTFLGQYVTKHTVRDDLAPTAPVVEPVTLELDAEPGSAVA